jgi:hypothetical protein
MTTSSIMTVWELGHDRYGRRVTMTCKGEDFEIEIEPCNQRDDGERIHSLSAPLLIEAARIAAERR